MSRRPYHLCFVDSMRPMGGAEVWILDTAQQLQDRGLAVSIITQPDAAWLPRIQSAGVAYTTIPLRCDGAPWTWFKLARWFRAHKVTAIVANRTKDLKACAVAGRLAQVPVIFGTRESDFPLKDKLYYRLYFNTLATGLLVNSLATEHTVMASAPWLHEERVHLLYKGIATGRFTPAVTPADHAVVGFAGQFIERKGLLDLMAAWSLIEQQEWPAGQRPQLRLAGSGPLATRIHHWRADLAHPDQVEIVGYCEDMPTFYGSLSLLVMPSLAEGFGLAAAEASACSLPVIATRTSSLPEIITHDRTGLLVPPANPRALQEAIGKLCLDPALRRKMGAAGRARIMEKFDLDTSLDRLVALTQPGS